MSKDSKAVLQEKYKSKLKDLKIGENIRYHRHLRNMNVDELARLSGLSPAFVGLIERGQRGCGLHNILQFAEIFGISVDELVCGENQQASADDSKVSADIRHIDSLLLRLSPDELQFVLATIKNLVELQASR